MVVWKNGLSSKEKLSMNFFPDLQSPESLESNSKPVTRGISHYLFCFNAILVILSQLIQRTECKCLT